MARYRINAPYPGSYVEGFGVLKSGEEYELPEKLILRDEDGKPVDERIIAPHSMWWPLDDHARELFAKYGRTPKPEPQLKKKPQPPDDDRMTMAELAAGKKLPRGTAAAASKRASDTE